jgi:hypothetical protein
MKDPYNLSTGGKGSKRRPTDETAYASGYAAAFGERQPWYERQDRLAWLDHNEPAVQQRLRRLINEKQNPST